MRAAAAREIQTTRATYIAMRQWGRGRKGSRLQGEKDLAPDKLPRRSCVYDDIRARREAAAACVRVTVRVIV